QEVITKALAKIHASGKASGILTSNRDLAKSYAELGVGFLAVGSDVGVLVSGLQDLRAAF
ncbi:MAG: 2-keto-3-deoxy-L-rhamnonate aldolase, partial [Mangrovicoccus sp.]